MPHQSNSRKTSLWLSAIILIIKLVEGDMADLSAFEDGSFQLIYNQPSTLFVPDVAPVWRECYRVLQADGVLITGFINPDEFVFDDVALDNEGVSSSSIGCPMLNMKH